MENHENPDKAFEFLDNKSEKKEKKKPYENAEISSSAKKYLALLHHKYGADGWDRDFRERMERARPNRSDVHLSGDEAAKAEAAARDYFDAAAPKRHTKPQRSDHSANYADALASDDQVTAEYTHFQELEKDTEVSS